MVEEYKLTYNLNGEDMEKRVSLPEEIFLGPPIDVAYRILQLAGVTLNEKANVSKFGIVKIENP